MIILDCNNISLSYGTKTILDHINFSIQETDKVGVVGVNGAGKSTLFNIIAGNLYPDEGSITFAKGISCGYLRQNTGLDSSHTLWEEVLMAYSHLIRLEEKMRELELEINREKEEVRLGSLVKEYSSLCDRYSAQGGYEYVSRAKGILRGLGFRDEDFDRKVDTLSGGQKTRLSLAKLLSEDPDLLLLDEPTNHLDLGSIEWLEGYIRDYKKAVMVISHDRYFLDQIVNRIIEIEHNVCTSYNGNYTSYVKQKEVDREIQLKHYQLQQREIQRLEEFIEQQRRWNREKNIIAAESRQKAIDRMEKVEKPADLPQKIRIDLKSRISSGYDVLMVENLSASYPGRKLFSGVNFKIRKGERVFLLGPNGCGKTTLFRIITGNKMPDSGICRHGHKVQPGYYDQEQSNLDESATILEEVWNGNDDLGQTAVRNTLAAFLFQAEDVQKSISVLSGGEKSRVCLVKLMLSGANFLLLDEPTNHLDIFSREVLESALLDYDGTILAISHDRYFIRKLSTRILEMYPGGVADYNGGYDYYQERRSAVTNHPASEPAVEKLSVSKEQRLRSKEEKAAQKKSQKLMENIEATIEKIEDRLQEIEKEMSGEKVASDHQKLFELHEESSRLREELDELYAKWAELA